MSSTQQSKLASKPNSNEQGAHPASGQRPAVRFRSDEATEPSETGGFSGTCENTPLTDWIQLVQMGRRDAELSIEDYDGNEAILWFREGDIVDAWCNGSVGEEAVYRALAWAGGRVSVAFAPCERERRIDTATPALLLHAAYRKDSELPRSSSAVTSSPFASTPGLDEAFLENEIPAPVASSPVIEISLTVDSSPIAADCEALDSPPLIDVAPDSTPPSESEDSRAKVRKRVWLTGIVLGGLLLSGLALFFPSVRPGALRAEPCVTAPSSK